MIAFQTRGPAILGGIWLAAFATSLAIPLGMILGDRVREATALAAAESVSSIYAPYVGAVLAYSFAKRKADKSKSPGNGPLPFVVALAVSLLWNLTLWALLARVLWQPISLIDTIQHASELSAKLSWLLSPAMGYYFATDASSRRVR